MSFPFDKILKVQILKTKSVQKKVLKKVLVKSIPGLVSFLGKSAS
jgi:hypothetical protein